MYRGPYSNFKITKKNNHIKMSDVLLGNNTDVDLKFFNDVGGSRLIAPERFNTLLPGYKHLVESVSELHLKWQDADGNNFYQRLIYDGDKTLTLEADPWTDNYIIREYDGIRNKEKRKGKVRERRIERARARERAREEMYGSRVSDLETRRRELISQIKTGYTQDLATQLSHVVQELKREKAKVRAKQVWEEQLKEAAEATARRKRMAELLK